MSVQYITDSNGQTTGVFIPIKEWNDLKSKFKDIDQSNPEIPEWHRQIVRERMELYKKNGESLNFDDAIDEIEKQI